MKTSLNRRQFLKRASASAGVVAWTASAWAQVPGANDDLRVAVVGFNGRGRDHIDGYRKLKGVRLVALCDVDRKVLDAEGTRLETAGISTAKFTDIRQLLESRDIDAVSIATPNHWHSLMGIWACQAGKDVYVEKPVSHNVWEGRQLVNAAKTHQRIVQTGTQSRSSPALHEAVAFVRSGAIGKIKLARGFCYKPRQSIGSVTSPTPVPEHIQYDLWCGPTPKHPLMRKKLHYDWHWNFETGNGDVGNQGIHQMDIARWFLGENGLSPRILSVGARLGYKDDGNTPNTQVILHDYATAPLVFEVRGLPKSKAFQEPSSAWGKNMPDFRGVQIGVVIECEGGWVRIPNYESATVYDASGKELKKFSRSGDHFANFVAAVRSRKTTDLNAPIVDGHLSSALCHTGNISHRLGQPLGPEAIRDRLKDNPVFAEAFGRMVEHLQLNEVDLAATPLAIGPTLTMNPLTETFVGNPEANKLLREEGRAPFVVPAIT
jgi:predicted dehydrogenase